MADDYDYLDGSEGQMFHDFYNNYEDGEAVVVCPKCGNKYIVSGDDYTAECPYCGEVIDIE